jgi:hypothetical protein
MEENITQVIVHNSMEEISSEVYTSMEDIYIIIQMCDVADGIDLTQGACKPRRTFHSVCGKLLYLSLYQKVVLWAG